MAQDVLAKLQRAAAIADQNTQQAVAAAHQTSMQLRVAEDRIARLEAEIGSYKERAARAEGWLQHISQEIEQLFPTQGKPSQDTYALRRESLR